MDFVLGGDTVSGGLTTSTNSTVTLQGKPGVKSRCRVLSYVPRVLEEASPWDSEFYTVTNYNLAEFSHLYI